MKNIKIAPSILSADFGKINKEIKKVENFSDFIHVDVMDGHFVPNITIGAPFVRCLKSKIPLDCHLMIENPEKYILDFIKAGAGMISTHIELGEESVKKCQKICKENGVKYGVAINPPTKFEKIMPVLDFVDFVLVMSVNPGFGGQSFIEEVLEKVEKVKDFKKDLIVEIDGGINGETCKLAQNAGVDILVAGSYIFGSEDFEKRIEELR